MFGVTIKNYCAYNRRFYDNYFMPEVKDYQKSISFCLVNAYFYNSNTEKRIGDIQDKQMSQTQKAIPVVIHLYTLKPHA